MARALFMGRARCARCPSRSRPPSSTVRPPMESAALLALTIACFAVSTPLVRVALGGATAPSVALLRCALAAAVLLVAGRRELRQLARREVLLTALAGVIFGIHLAFYTAGVGATSIVGAVTMISMEPALVLLASTLV